MHTARHGKRGRGSVGTVPGPVNVLSRIMMVQLGGPVTWLHPGPGLALNVIVYSRKGVGEGGSPLPINPDLHDCQHETDTLGR